MTTTAAVDNDPIDTTNWPAAGLILDAITRRDFDALAECLDPMVRMRGLLPPGPFELAGAQAAAGKFRQWFGGQDGYEVIDASIGQLGERCYLRWRIRMVSADGSARLVEQHAFSRGTTRVEAIDLLCSGFQAEPAG